MRETKIIQLIFCGWCFSSCRRIDDGACKVYSTFQPQAIYQNLFLLKQLKQNNTTSNEKEGIDQEIEIWLIRLD